jgi:hypothetical protein
LKFFSKQDWDANEAMQARRFLGVVGVLAFLPIENWEANG